MTKIALSLLALAALSTASFADRSRDDFGTSGSHSGGVVIESAPLAVYGRADAVNRFEGKQGGR
jgi:hypothetical protein